MFKISRWNNRDWIISELVWLCVNKLVQTFHHRFVEHVYDHCRHAIAIDKSAFFLNFTFGRTPDADWKRWQSVFEATLIRSLHEMLRMRRTHQKVFSKDFRAKVHYVGVDFLQLCRNYFDIWTKYIRKVPHMVHHVRFSSKTMAMLKGLLIFCVFRWLQKLCYRSKFIVQ